MGGTFRAMRRTHFKSYFSHALSLVSHRSGMLYVCPAPWCALCVYFVCMYVRVHACTCVYLHVCVCARAHVYVCWKAFDDDYFSSNPDKGPGPSSLLRWDALFSLLPKEYNQTCGTRWVRSPASFQPSQEDHLAVQPSLRLSFIVAESVGPCSAQNHGNHCSHSAEAKGPQ